MQNKRCHRAAIMSWEMILNDWFTNQISDTGMQKYSFLYSILLTFLGASLKCNVRCSVMSRVGQVETLEFIQL